MPIVSLPDRGWIRRPTFAPGLECLWGSSSPQNTTTIVAAFCDRVVTFVLPEGTGAERILMTPDGSARAESRPARRPVPCRGLRPETAARDSRSPEKLILASIPPVCGPVAEDVAQRATDDEVLFDLPRVRPWRRRGPFLDVGGRNHASISSGTFRLSFQAGASGALARARLATTRTDGSSGLNDFAFRASGCRLTA